MSNLDKILEKARIEREKGNAKQALDLFNDAILLAQKKGKRTEIVQALTDRAIVFRHLFELNHDMVYAIFARKDAETMLEMVKLWGISEKLHTSYFMLGQASLLFNDNKSAENYFFKSLRYFKGHPAEKGSWRYHYAKSLYLIGEKKRGLLAFSQALNEIKSHMVKTDPFLFEVYLSGAYLAFAEVLFNDNQQESKKYLEMAREIINSNKKLVIRKRQLKTFESKVKYV